MSSITHRYHLVAANVFGISSTCPVKVVQLQIVQELRAMDTCCDTRKNASNTGKRITNKQKWYKKGRKVSFVRSVIVDE